MPFLRAVGSKAILYECIGYFIRNYGNFFFLNLEINLKLLCGVIKIDISIDLVGTASAFLGTQTTARTIVLP